MSDQSDPNATERQRIEFAIDQSISDEEWDAFNDWRRLRDEAAPSVQPSGDCHCHCHQSGTVCRHCVPDLFEAEAAPPVRDIDIGNEVVVPRLTGDGGLTADAWRPATEGLPNPLTYVAPPGTEVHVPFDDPATERLDVATLYVTMSHNLNHGLGRLWEWWDDASESWRKGDSVEFVDALVAAYRARLSSPEGQEK